MTIYELLKNSSPSMAKHFMDSENGIKELKNRVTALEDPDEPIVYEKVITGNSQFSVRDRVVGNETKKEYYIIEKIDTEHGKLHRHNPNFTPHACIYTCENNTDGTIKTEYYVEIPIMDDYDVLRTRDVAGISIGRSYDKNQYLKEIIITVTESIYLGLGNETIESIIVYL